MTAPLPVTEDVRRLIAEARALVAGFDGLVAAAPDDQARDWAQFTARSARQRWEQLIEVVRAGAADDFDRRLSGLVSATRPLEDSAPVSLRDQAQAVSRTADVLAADAQRTFWPFLTPPDYALPPEVLAAVGTALREVAPELGS